MSRFAKRTLYYGALFGLPYALGACSVDPRIDARPIEQQLADRPVPSFSPEFIAALSNDDSASPVPRLPAGSARGCAPISPPIRAMLREKVFRIDGVIAATILPSGLVDEVVAINVVPAIMTSDVETLFATALRTKPCRFPMSRIIKRIEIPFTLKLD